MKAKVLVLAGDGINCERETASAFVNAGLETKILHSNDLLANPNQLADFQALALPGGFSFGDDLGSGQVLALKLELVLADNLRRFVEAEKPIIGICNGFQALTKLGLLPHPFQKRVLALAKNSGGHFQDRWVKLEATEKSPCIWTKQLFMETDLQLPIRHGEGRIVIAAGEEEVIHQELSAAGQIPLRYQQDINGSYGRIAAICDPKGLVFGLMPHPEAAVSQLLYPYTMPGAGKTAPGLGQKFFTNCAQFLRER